MSSTNPQKPNPKPNNVTPLPLTNAALATPIIDYDNLPRDEFTERIVATIVDKLNGRENLTFFRQHVAYYFACIAALTRTTIVLPDGSTDFVNFFGVNLAPTGYGKGMADGIMNRDVISGFQTKYIGQTLPDYQKMMIERWAGKNALRDGIEFEQAKEQLVTEVKSAGPVMFFFEKPSEAGLKQQYALMQMSEMGSLNLRSDEIATALPKSNDAIDSFLTLYDGEMVRTLNKHTKESQRAASYQGRVPANFCMYGLASTLMDNSVNQAAFIKMLKQGYARRCFFTYIPDGKHRQNIVDPLQRLAKLKTGSANKALSDINKQITLLASPSKLHSKIHFEDSAYLLLCQFDNDSRETAYQMLEAHPYPSEELLMIAAETENRMQKVQRLAAIYAHMSASTSIKDVHVLSAIHMAIDSSAQFKELIQIEEPYERLAKFIASSKRELTYPRLQEKLPFFKKATKAERDSMITDAIAWGYTNSVLIKRRVSENVELISGEALQQTDLNKIILSYSNDMTEGYTSQEVPWDALHKLATAPNMHWINHALDYGSTGAGYRHDDNVLPGFNLIVIDIDQKISYDMVKHLLGNYKMLLYRTKRDSQTAHRFRVIFPTNYTLKLDKEEFASFMENLYEWLPFSPDENTGQRSRKWLASATHYEYNDGELFDVLPLIPKTIKNEDHQQQILNYENVDGLHRWFATHTYEGNRNNNTLRYAHVLADMGLPFEAVRAKIYQFNESLKFPMTRQRIDVTIMTTIGKRYTKKQP